ncbi:MAG: hypothetical protein LBJ74_05765 [Heliobacteriaceae bacterium]|jgi:hypothetical protein|nr:hypothetical protein [Heliobacteriaceae bacterium]
MNEIISFIKDIFMLEESGAKVGLSQFKTVSIPVEKREPKPVQTEVKLSDLMRKGNVTY